MNQPDFEKIYNKYQVKSLENYKYNVYETRVKDDNERTLKYTVDAGELALIANWYISKPYFKKYFPKFHDEFKQFREMVKNNSFALYLLLSLFEDIINHNKNKIYDTLAIIKAYSKTNRVYTAYRCNRKCEKLINKYSSIDRMITKHFYKQLDYIKEFFEKNHEKLYWLNEDI